MLEDVVLAWRAHALRYATDTSTSSGSGSGSCPACDASPFTDQEAIPRDAPHTAIHPLVAALEVARAEAARDAAERLYRETRGPLYRDHPFGMPAFVDYGEREDDIRRVVDDAMARELARSRPSSARHSTASWPCASRSSRARSGRSWTTATGPEPEPLF